MKKISSYSGKTKLYLESNSPNTIKNNLVGLGFKRLNSGNPKNQNLVQSFEYRLI